MIGYKLLTKDLSSLSDEHGRVQYGPDWVEVPGNGAYIGITLPGLLRGGFGDVLARVEYAEPTGFVDDGEVVTARRVRVLAHVPLDIWAIVRTVIWAAEQVIHPGGNPLRAVCLNAITAARTCERERTKDALWAASWAARTAREAWAAENAALVAARAVWAVREAEAVCAAVRAAMAAARVVAEAESTLAPRIVERLCVEAGLAERTKG